MTEKAFKKNFKNLKGSFAVENMSVSKHTADRLKRLAAGSVTCTELVEEIKRRYTQETPK